MLELLLKGKEKSPVILLKDNVTSPGKTLLKTFIHYLIDRVDRVHIFCYEDLPHHVLKDISTDRVIAYNIACDPIGWNSCSNHGDGNPITMTTDICRTLEATIGDSDKVAIVIDSLSPLLLHCSAAYLCKMIHRLTTLPSKEVCQLVLLLHADLHDHTTIAMVQHMCSSVVTLVPSEDSRFQAGCQITQCRPSGKVVRNKEHFNVNKDNYILELEEFRSPLQTINSSENEPDPTADLTFNLTLTEKEKEDRKKLQLPFIHSHQRKVAELNSSQGSGKIFYQPDTADDFDEEDPDDDLDI